MNLKYDCQSILNKSNLPWIKYNMELENNNIHNLLSLKKDLLDDDRIKNLISECAQWPNIPLNRHNDAGHIIHKMCMLLDFGLTYEDKGMRKIADKILSHQSEDGGFLTMLNISKNFGGTGKESLDWIICDFPILLYVLLKLGLEKNEQVQKAIELLKSIAMDNGYRCVGSVEKFRGPGKKADYCPYGTLVSLKAFSLLPQYHDSDFVKTSIDSILLHWDNQKERKIRMFGIGTDFRKLKYPNIWYDIVNVTRILSEFDYAKKSNAFNEMVKIIIEKQQITGGFIPESIYMKYKGWDFGQKKVSSATLTYQIYRIFQNIN